MPTLYSMWVGLDCYLIVYLPMPGCMKALLLKLCMCLSIRATLSITRLMNCNILLFVHTFEGRFSMANLLCLNFYVHFSFFYSFIIYFFMLYNTFIHIICLK